MRDRLLSKGSALENLKQLLLEWQEMHSQPGSFGCMIGTNIADFTTEDEEIAKLLRSYLQQVEDLFCTTLTQAQVAGEVSSSIEPRDLARFFVCTTQGVALVGRVMENEQILQGAISTALKLLDNS